GARLAGATGRLRALSPRAVLDRGYAIVRGGAGGAIVRDAAELAAGAPVQVALARGTLHATVVEVRVDAEQGVVARG
ncbi:MAG: Exonuclease large subunit, partial [Thermoleophilia bacterium]|nr:Exonuclease large subunit [Thermoleophilia bacterium]